jgi:hypothetical protein
MEVECQCGRIGNPRRGLAPDAASIGLPKEVSSDDTRSISPVLGWSSHCTFVEYSRAPASSQALRNAHDDGHLNRSPSEPEKRPKTLKPALRPVSHPSPEGGGGIDDYEFRRLGRAGQGRLGIMAWLMSSSTSMDTTCITVRSSGPRTSDRATQARRTTSRFTCGRFARSRTCRSRTGIS